jgi:hypothetical protein
MFSGVFQHWLVGVCFAVGCRMSRITTSNGNKLHTPHKHCRGCRQNTASSSLQIVMALEASLVTTGDACRMILCRKHPATGDDHPVQYWSKALALAEHRYSATNLGCKRDHDAIMH